MSATIKVCIVQRHCYRHSPDLPYHLYASGAAENEGTILLDTTAGEDETSEGNPGNRNGDAVDVALAPGTSA